MNKHAVVFVLLSLIAMMQGLMSQTVYKIPFASTGNVIELTVANTSESAMTSVAVRATNLPSWIRFAQAEEQLGLLKAQQEMLVKFSFSVDKSAPVEQSQILKFKVSGSGGPQGEKEITVSVAPPERFELFQNFPNPFNPTTAISYQLSAFSDQSRKSKNL